MFAILCTRIGSDYSVSALSQKGESLPIALNSRNRFITLAGDQPLTETPLDPGYENVPT